MVYFSLFTPKKVYAHPTGTFNFGLVAVCYQTPMSSYCRAKCEIRSVIQFVYVKTESIEMYSEQCTNVKNDYKRSIEFTTSPRWYVGLPYNMVAHWNVRQRKQRVTKIFRVAKVEHSCVKIIGSFWMITVFRFLRFSVHRGFCRENCKIGVAYETGFANALRTPQTSVRVRSLREFIRANEKGKFSNSIVIGDRTQAFHITFETRTTLTRTEAALFIILRENSKKRNLPVKTWQLFWD